MVAGSDTIFVWLQVVKNFIFFNQPAEPELPWYGKAYVYGMDMVSAAWAYRLMFLRDVALFVTLIILFYVFWIIIQKVRKIDLNKSTTNVSTAPTIYNNTMNIHVWLNEFSDYLDTRKTTSDKDKQNAILERLDKTSRNVVRKLIEDNKIKNYNELEEYLRSFFGNNVFSSSDYIIQLTERKQKPDESLSQFYTAVSDLATRAYPDTPRQTVEQFTTKQFILGLNNRTIRDQLLLNSSVDEKTNVLSRAVELQAKLACVSNDAVETYNVQHVEAKSNQCSIIKPSHTNNRTQSNTNNNQHNSTQQNPWDNPQSDWEQNRARWHEFMSANYQPYQNNAAPQQYNNRDNNYSRERSSYPNGNTNNASNANHSQSNQHNQHNQHHQQNHYNNRPNPSNNRQNTNNNRYNSNTNNAINTNSNRTQSDRAPNGETLTTQTQQ
jgi:hypothetical protein